MKPERLLVCLGYGIGDVVMQLPALRALRAARPHAELWLLGAHPALQLLEEDADFQQVVRVQDFGFAHWGDSGDSLARARFREWLLRADFSCVLDPSHAVAGARETIFAAPVNWLDSRPHPQAIENGAGGEGIAAFWRAAMTTWGLPTQATQLPSLRIASAARDAAENRLHRWLDLSRNVIGIAPIASSPLKRWPIERLLTLARWLIHERNHQLLVFGFAGDESAVLRAWQDVAAADDLMIVPHCHLRETVALISQCRAFISNDTGLMHIAAALGVQTLGLFGPTAAAVYQPPNASALRSGRSCPYRLLDKFGPPQCVQAGHCLIASTSCIEDIDTSAVQREIDQLIAPVAVNNAIPAARRWQGNGAGVDR